MGDLTPTSETMHRMATRHVDDEWIDRAGELEKRIQDALAAYNEHHNGQIDEATCIDAMMLALDPTVGVK